MVVKVRKGNTKDVNISDDVDDLFDVLDTTVKLDDLFLENDEKSIGIRNLWLVLF